MRGGMSGLIFVKLIFLQKPQNSPLQQMKSFLLGRMMVYITGLETFPEPHHISSKFFLERKISVL